MIRNPEFAERLEKACEDYEHCPTEQHRGKQKWLKDNLEKRFQIKVSAEAVRKWFAGESKPRPKVVTAISSILHVDEAWLSLGIVPDMTEGEKKQRQVIADGASLFVAGLLQLAGAHTTFPLRGDIARPDITAIIDGQAREIDVALANTLDDGTLKFVIKDATPERVTLGVIPDVFGARVIVLHSNLLSSHSHLRGGFREVIVSADSGEFTINGCKLSVLSSLDVLC